MVSVKIEKGLLVLKREDDIERRSPISHAYYNILHDGRIQFILGVNVFQEQIIVDFSNVVDSNGDPFASLTAFEEYFDAQQQITFPDDYSLEATQQDVLSELTEIKTILEEDNLTPNATSDNQVEMIAQLDSLITETENQGGNIADIRDSSNAILAELQSDISAKRLTVRLDQVSDNLFYVGKALIGSLDSQDLWQIVRYTTTGTILKSEYANGSEEFNRVWDDRATLTYI
jgi:hypothetical protein